MIILKNRNAQLQTGTAVWKNVYQFPQQQFFLPHKTTIPAFFVI